MKALLYLLLLFARAHSFDLSFLDKIDLLSHDPEQYMTALEMIRYWGYPGEVHDVLTQDGFIMSMFRLPYGRYSDRNSSCHRPPILLAQGLGEGAVAFILNPPESSPAFLLADAGFDVFILDQRGGTYSKRHTTLAPWDNKFWQWTLDEMSKYDGPAAIDKVLEITGDTGTYWVGHSQGTAVGFMTLADNPSYNKKIKGLFQLGPAGTGGMAKGLLRAVFMLVDFLKPVTDLYRVTLGSHEVPWSWPFVFRPIGRICNLIPIPYYKEVCGWTLIPLLGPSTRIFNITRLPTYLSHIPTATSTWNALHWAQMATRLSIEHMDHNPLENVQRYGQETPPPYDYSKIDTPVYFFVSEADWCTTPAELENIIKKKLRKEVIKDTFMIDGYGHLDYVLAPDIKETVFDPITKIVRAEDRNMYESHQTKSSLLPTLAVSPRTMRLLLLFALTGQAYGSNYKAFSSSRQRKSLLGPFPAASQEVCQLACDCARGDASAAPCDQFNGIVPTMNCWIYYYSKSHCTFLGEYTPNTCQLPITEYQLDGWLEACQATTPFPTTTTPKTTPATKSTATTTQISSKCPPNGVWSEWEQVGDCLSTCGAFGQVPRKRICSSKCGDCPCTGPATEEWGPCNIALCPQEPQCSYQYSKKLNNVTNQFFCGTQDVPDIECP